MGKVPAIFSGPMVPVLGIGVALGTLAGTVMAGWFAQSVLLTQISLVFVPMQFNTALLFLATAVGLTAIVFDYHRAALGIGVIIVTVALLTIYQYLFGLDLGIDTLFLEPFTVAKTSHAGRMAPNTAMCFLLAGSALLLLDLRKTAEWHLAGAGVSGSLVAGIGLVALAGYISGAESAFQWRYLTAMAVHTSIGFVLLGAGTLFIAWQRSADFGSSLPRWYTITIGIGFLTLVIAIWYVAAAQEQRVAERLGDLPSSILNFILIAGVALAALGTLTIHMARKDHLQARILESANTQLQAEIKHRRQAEKELIQSIADLAVANKELEAFSYAVSHDLRAPLRALDGFSHALIEDFGETLDGQAKEYLQRIRNASSRMGTLIDDLLGLSRLSRKEMNVKDVDLSGVARGIGGDLRRFYSGRSVELLVEDGLTARADEDLMRIALQNLLGNAWKFTGNRQDARIEFGKFANEEGQSVYFVRDNGTGFDMAYADKLFTPFQRLHRQGEFEGTGIGLVTVKRIVHRHDGRIWFDSKPGEGATFYFTLAEGGLHGG